MSVGVIHERAERGISSCAYADPLVRALNCSVQRNRAKRSIAMTTRGSRQLRSRTATGMVFAMAAILLLGASVSPAMAAPGNFAWTKLVPQGLLDLTAVITQGPGGAAKMPEYPLPSACSSTFCVSSGPATAASTLSIGSSLSTVAEMVTSPPEKRISAGSTEASVISGGVGSPFPLSPFPPPPRARHHQQRDRPSSHSRYASFGHQPSDVIVRDRQRPSCSGVRALVC